MQTSHYAVAASSRSQCSVVLPCTLGAFVPSAIAGPGGRQFGTSAFLFVFAFSGEAACAQQDVLMVTEIFITEDHMLEVFNHRQRVTSSVSSWRVVEQEAKEQPATNANKVI